MVGQHEFLIRQAALLCKQGHADSPEMHQIIEDLTACQSGSDDCSAVEQCWSAGSIGVDKRHSIHDGNSSPMEKLPPHYPGNITASSPRKNYPRGNITAPKLRETPSIPVSSKALVQMFFNFFILESDFDPITHRI